jgi:hypothetical protein
MLAYSCKKCGDLNYLTPHAYWNITDYGTKCEKCETINTITLEKGELQKQVYTFLVIIYGIRNHVITPVLRLSFLQVDLIQLVSE